MEDGLENTKDPLDNYTKKFPIILLGCIYTE